MFLYQLIVQGLSVNKIQSLYFEPFEENERLCVDGLKRLMFV